MALRYSTGRRTVTTLPSTPWPEFLAIAERRARLVADHTETGARLLELRTELKAAEAEHRSGYARAIADGKAEPSRKQIEKIETEIDSKVRRLVALDDAVDAIERDLAELIDAKRTAWESDAGALEGKAREEFRAAVDALQEARVKLAERTALVRFLSLIHI